MTYMTSIIKLAVIADIEVSVIVHTYDDGSTEALVSLTPPRGSLQPETALLLAETIKTASAMALRTSTRLVIR